jgi:hypothetical protein
MTGSDGIARLRKINPAPAYGDARPLNVNQFRSGDV